MRISTYYQRLYSILLCLLLFWQAQGQGRLQGHCIDSLSKKGIASAILSARDEQNQQIGYAISLSDGSWELSWDHGTPTSIIIKKIGYGVRKLKVQPTSTPLTIRMSEATIELKEVSVMGRPIRQQGDTISFLASRFRTASTYSLEDLIKRIPSLSVEPNGKIKYMGEDIEGVMIEGLDMLSNRYAVATRNIRAEDVRAVDVMERFQKIKALRGVRRPEGATLNIKLKNKNMIRPTGKISVGGGMMSGDPISPLYSIHGTALIFNSKLHSINELGTRNATLGGGIESRGSSSQGGTASASLLPQTHFNGQGSMRATHMQTHGINLNSLHRLSEDGQLTWNASYEHGRERSNNSSHNRWYRDTGDIIYDEEDRLWQQLHTAGLGLKYTYNADTRFVENDLKLRYSQGQTEHQLLRNAQPIEQFGGHQEFAITNNWQRTKRKANGDVSELNLYLSHHRTPLSKLYSPSRNYAFEQRVWGADYLLGFDLTYNKALGPFYLSGVLSTTGKYANLYSQMQSTPEPSLVQGGGITIATTPRLSYKRAQWNIVLSLPLSLLLQNYRYADRHYTKQSTNLRELLPGVGLSIDYIPSAAWHIGLSTQLNTDIVHSLQEFVLTPLRTSYDRLSTGRDLLTLPRRRRMSATFKVLYRHPILGLFSDLRLMASRTHRNQLIALDVRAEGTTATPIDNNHWSDNFLGNFSVSKQIFSLSSKVGIDLGGSISIMPMIRSGQLNQVRHLTYRIAPNIMVTPATWLDLSLNANYSYSQSHSTIGEVSTQEWGYGGLITLTPFPSWQVVLSGNREAYLNSRMSNPPFTRLGASIRYEVRKHSLTLSARNLLDQRALISYHLSDLDEFRSVYSLRGRELILTYSYKY